MKTFEYYVEFESETGLFVISVPELDLLTQAESQETVDTEVRDAIWAATGNEDFQIAEAVAE